MAISIFQKSIIYFLRLLRIYSVYFPINKGKEIIIFVQRRLILNLKSLVAVSIDNRKFHLKIPEDMERTSIFSAGYCEKDLTLLFQRIIRKDDILFDLGANIGWYTTLFGRDGGQCHAFEPNPQVFSRLIYNCEINEIRKNKLYLNNLAVGDKESVVSFYSFRNLHHGLSSLSDFGRDDKIEIKVEKTTLTEYVFKKDIKHIDIIKVDVEGAELEVLKGSQELLSSGYSPIWVFEMNEETSNAFNYKPSDILMFLKDYGYSFYVIEKKIRLMKSIYDYFHGSNVLCINPDIHSDKIEKIYE